MNQPLSFDFKINIPTRLLVLFLVGFGISIETHAHPEHQYDKGNKVKASKAKPVVAMNKEKQIELSKQHLASELEMGAESIKLVMFESVTWRSGAMGCPKPGMMYTQALVPGVLIRLSVDGKTYRYHAASKGEPFYCPNNIAESPSANSGDA